MAVGFDLLDQDGSPSNLNNNVFKVQWWGKNAKIVFKKHKFMYAADQRCCTSCFRVRQGAMYHRNKKITDPKKKRLKHEKNQNFFWQVTSLSLVVKAFRKNWRWDDEEGLRRLRRRLAWIYRRNVLHQDRSCRLVSSRKCVRYLINFNPKHTTYLH